MCERGKFTFMEKQLIAEALTSFVENQDEVELENDETARVKLTMAERLLDKVNGEIVAAFVD